MTLYSNYIIYTVSMISTIISMGINAQNPSSSSDSFPKLQNSLPTINIQNQLISTPLSFILLL